MKPQSSFLIVYLETISFLLTVRAYDVSPKVQTDAKSSRGHDRRQLSKELQLIWPAHAQFLKLTFRFEIDNFDDFFSNFPKLFWLEVKTGYF